MWTGFIRTIIVVTIARLVGVRRFNGDFEQTERRKHYVPSMIVGKESNKVSLIIVNWNGERFLKDCLRTLSNQSYANCEIIALVNNDAHVKKTWLENLIQPMLWDGTIGICASRLIFDNTQTVNSAGDGLTNGGSTNSC